MIDIETQSSPKRSAHIHILINMNVSTLMRSYKIVVCIWNASWIIQFTQFIRIGLAKDSHAFPCKFISAIFLKLI